MDRRQALAGGTELPDRTHGAALFADISGFTPLTAALVEDLGPQRGAEELIRHLNQVYGTLISALHSYSGSVIGFSGDAITCWLDGDNGKLSSACALAMREGMDKFAHVETPRGSRISLDVKVAVVTGPTRRFLVGDPKIQRLEALGGATLERMAAAEKLAERGEVVVGADVAHQVGDQLEILEWRSAPSGERFAAVARLSAPVPPVPWPAHPPIPDETARPWIFPAVYQRLCEGQSEFLAELRPAAALFIKFWGIDYDGDDDAGTKLDAYVRWVQRVVTGYEGYLVDITVGDKGSYLYAAFGAPVAHEDDPARAVAAALDLRSPPAKLKSIAGMQMGISLGRMRSGAVGGPMRRTYGVMGNEVNVAARLMSMAEPGEIRVSPRVAKAAAGRFEFESLGTVMLKGLPDPMPVLAAIDRTMAADTKALKGRTLAPLVGRAAERAKMAEQLHTLQEGQAGGILIIEGEAGIGKSRLAMDLVEQAQAIGIATLLGAGQSIEQQTPYRAWRDVLGAYFGLEEIQAPTARQERVQETLSDVAPDHVQRLPLLNDVLNLGLPENDLTSVLSPELRQQSLFLLLTELLRAGIVEHPLLLVLEDAHWLDGLSWDLAVYVARTLGISGEPFMLALVTRPPDRTSVAAQHVDTLTRMKGAETLALAGLDPDEMVSLVTHRLGLPPGGLPDTVARLVRDRAGGNPLFAEELVFALRDQELIQVSTPAEGDEPQCTVSEALNEASLPDTVQGLVLSRIDRLPPEQQLTLKVASVIGRTFPYTPLLHTLKQHADTTEARLDAQLTSLAELDLTPLDTPEPEPTYIFRHATTQEVAYETLLFAQRRDLHHTVAAWYEESFGASETELAPHLPLLVHHYHYAEENDKERLYAGLAGHRAAAQYANNEAIRYLSRALELTPEEEATERYDLLLARERVNDLLGEREAQRLDIEALETISEAAEDTQQRVQVSLRRAILAEVLGDYSGAVTAAQEAIYTAQTIRDAASEAAGHLRWGIALVRQGEYDAAQLRLEHAMTRARDASLRDLEADILRNLSIALRRQGDYDTALVHIRQAANISRQIGNPAGESNALNTIGNVHADLGNYDQARPHYERALGIYREIGDLRGENMALFNLGAILADQGIYSSAQQYYDESLQTSRRSGDRLMAAHALNNLSLVLFYQGRYPEATALSEEAAATYHEIGDAQGEGSVLSNLALIACRTGYTQAAQAHGLEALRIAREIGDRSTEAEALNHLGHIATDLELGAEATDSYSNSLDIRRQLGEQNLALESLAGLARVTLTKGEPVEALAYVDEILDILETGSLDGAYEPFLVYLSCYRVLQENQDPRAVQVLETAQNMLQERASRIEDEDARDSFLENVTTHREIVSAWEKHRE
jgi:predicted ATPase/class 3 adenylate cyclase